MRKVIRIASLAVIVIAACQLVRMYLSEQSVEQIYEDASEQYVTETDEESLPETADSSPIEVDFEALQAANPDIVGWIYALDGAISYPILYSGDNSTYLRTDYMMNHCTGGSIFMEGANSPDLSDPTTIIYGHNMHNGTMFGQLKQVEVNQFFYIITPEASYKYQVREARIVEPDDEIYDISQGQGRVVLSTCANEDRLVVVGNLIQR